MLRATQGGARAAQEVMVAVELRVAAQVVAVVAIAVVVVAAVQLTGVVVAVVVHS